MSLRLCGASLLAACALVATGCGGGESSSAVRGQPISFQELAQSASTSADATSGRFSFEMSLTFPGTDQPFGLSGEGAFDEASDRTSFAVDMSSFAKLLGGLVTGLAGPDAQGAPDFDDPAGWKIDVVQDGDVGYVRFPAFDEQLPDDKSWVRTDETTTSSGFDFDEFEQFAQSDPRELLDSLRAVTSNVVVVRTESLRGVETTHYRAVVDPKDLAAKAAPGQQAEAQSLIDEFTKQSGLSEIPLDVWIDASGLVRKVAMTFSATDPSTSESSEVSVAFELWDYNEPVEIALPPASQVVDASAVHG